ncbi:unnamed protein product [Trichogramma brassicae]|uniref:Reverse transcriptase domain-containing protein n=1 Tax=Trichogramma brassicae TaxID=86971 RepID=A0A6H5IH52_9HYME|nr:unnamed protein product [Trichogramma brassicae]
MIGSVLAIPTKISSSPEMIKAAITRKILNAPLATTKDSPLPTPTDFATGSYEEKWTRIEGHVSGLAVFIEGNGNLHKEVVRYTASLVQAFSALSKTKRSLEKARPPTADKAVCGSPIFSVDATSKLPVTSPPAIRATPKRQAVPATSKQLDENNNNVGDQDGFVLVDHRHQRQRNQTATTSVSVRAWQMPKPRPARRRVHHRPDAIVIKAKDATTYADILRTLKSDPRLQQSVGSSAQNIRRSAAGALVLQLRENVDNSSTLGAELGKVIGDESTASPLQHTTMIVIRDLDECATKEKIAEALSTSLSAPHPNNDVVKKLRKAYAGTQMAVATLTDDQATRALKLSHIRIGWVNCDVSAHYQQAPVLEQTVRRSQRGRMGKQYETVMFRLREPRANTPSSPTLVRRIVAALFSCVPDEPALPAHTAPRPDGVPNSAIKIAIATHPDIFLQVYTACLRTGVFPARWKRQRLVLLPKPGKPHKEPQSYRPLCMLDTAGKILERIICDRLEAITESPGGLSDHQYGFRRGRSTINAIENVIATAREAIAGKGWNRATKKYCAVVTLDVKNAFNSARWINIKATLCRMCTPEYLLRIIGRYLSMRVLDNDTDNGPDSYRVTAGVPQRSVSGPILWNVMYDAVLSQPRRQRKDCRLRRRHMAVDADTRHRFDPPVWSAYLEIRNGDAGLHPRWYSLIGPRRSEGLTSSESNSARGPNLFVRSVIFGFLKKCQVLVLLPGYSGRWRCCTKVGLLQLDKNSLYKKERTGVVYLLECKKYLAENALKARSGRAAGASSSDRRTPPVKKPEKRSCSSPPSTSTEKVVKKSRTDAKVTLPADDGGAPAWFRAYEKSVNGTFGEITGRIDSLDARFGALDTRIEEIARQQGEQKGLIVENTREIRELNQRISSEITEFRGHLTNNLNEITAIRGDLNTVSRPVSAAHLDLLSSADLCEVRIAGIPSTVEMDSIRTAELVHEPLQLSRLAPLILKVRSWLPQTQASVEAATESTSSGITRRTMVVRLASAGARDVLLAAAPRLRLLPIGPIFGIEHGGPDRLHMSAILPGPLYGLYKKCQSASRALQYLPPIVRGLRIFMRQSRKSPLIPINGEADLAKLKPHTS